MQIIKPDINIDFVAKMGFFGIISTLVVISSIAYTGYRGLNLGIDFAGGYEIQVGFPKTVSEEDIKGIVNPLVKGEARVQRFGDAENNEYLILVRHHGSVGDEIKASVEADYQELNGGPLPIWSFAESGESLKVGFGTPITEEQVRDVLTKYELKINKVSRGDREDEPEFDVRLESLPDRIRAALMGQLELAESPVARQEFVGPQVGEQLRNQGFMAVLWALFFILIYIGIRFDLNFAPGAVVALVHDVSITIGLFAVFQLEFSLPIVAAILAIVGYSLNDTIVVYDRIRENIVRLRGRELRAMVNTSLNQTLSRTVLTSATTLLVLLALLFIGGGIIQDFAIALTIGVVVGTYSSMFIATPFYVLLRERSDRKGSAATEASTAAA